MIVAGNFIVTECAFLHVMTVLNSIPHNIISTNYAIGDIRQSFEHNVPHKMRQKSQTTINKLYHDLVMNYETCMEYMTTIQHSVLTSQRC